MELVKSIYTDKHQNEWIIEKVSLPNKRGTRITSYIAECNNTSFRHTKKSEVIKQIIQHVSIPTKS
jgi:hypothetical protein